MPGKFKLKAPFRAAGDQPAAIKKLRAGLDGGLRDQVLLGVTGSGKTFTMASLIAEMNRPSLVISPNKVLAAQLYSEFRTFFPENAVEYFVSYYDYYQPEAYIPSTDTYIEKDSAINQQLDKLRLKATASILSRSDTIVVASVSCIYNIGSPENFAKMGLYIEKGRPLGRRELTERLVAIRYERNDLELSRGKFRPRGAFVDIFPGDSETAFRVQLSDAVESIVEFDPLTGTELKEHKHAWIYPANHFVSTQAEIGEALGLISAELAERLAVLKKENKLVEAQRLEQRTRYDMEMLAQTGYCHGIENYSRHLAGRPAGERPACLFDYFPEDFLFFVDESHVTVPQVRGMYAGDRSRKQTLVDFGFRLPSALDNRPLKFDEFEALRPRTVYVSATPGPYELGLAGRTAIAEQIIRPTGLTDPPVRVLPLKGQVKALTEEIEKRAKLKERTLVLTLTKKTAEDLSEFLAGKGVRAKYIHSSMDTLERLDILGQFKRGEFDALVGINLLREGLDIPEVSLVAILNADNEGFLRSETTLMQIAGRAARNKCGEVLLFADRRTGSMGRALDEMDRRRKMQIEYNEKHGIKPESVARRELAGLELYEADRERGYDLVKDLSAVAVKPENVKGIRLQLEREMKEAADQLNFELAARLRDRLFELADMAGPGGKPRKAGRGRSRK